MSAVKLTLDNFKNTRQRQGRAKGQPKKGSYLYCYIWKNILFAGRKDEIEKKNGLKRKVEKHENMSN